MIYLRRHKKKRYGGLKKKMYNFKNNYGNLSQHIIQLFFKQLSNVFDKNSFFFKKKVSLVIYILLCNFYVLT